MTTAPKWIGQSVLRLEDPPLVRGCGRFAGDISFPHQLHMRVARSSYAHGKINSIDVTAARAVPGVVAVWTAAGIADVPPIDFREGRIPAYEPYRQPVLASEQGPPPRQGGEVNARHGRAPMRPLYRMTSLL